MEGSKILLEIVGYIGTVLTLMSMMMTSIVKLRTWSAIGSFISMVYAIINGAWPVVFLNVGLIAINCYNLYHLHHTKIMFDVIAYNPGDAGLKRFMKYHERDIQYCFPGYQFSVKDNTEVHIVFADNEAVGLLVGTREGTILHIELDYATPKYRDCSVADHLFAHLKSEGIFTLIVDRKPTDYNQHKQYLTKMGFENREGLQVKTL